MQKEFRWMVCFGSKWQNKKLPPATWIDLLKRIEAEFPSSFLFVFGDEKERETAEKMQIHFPHNSFCIGGMSLALWQALMSEMDGVLTVDSAALHLCATTATPSFSVFGPSLARIYKPSNAHHHAYQGSCPYDEKFAMRCPQLRTCKTGACMSQLEAADLFGAFQRWVRGNSLNIKI
jgi:heptosyltransferase-1